MTTPQDTLHHLLTEKRLHKRMALARTFRKQLQEKTLPLIRGNEVIFLWEGTATSVNVIGDWTHWRQQIPMKRVAGTSFFYVTQEFPSTARLQYKFVIDNTWQNDPANPHASQEGFGTNSELMMPDYRDESWLQPIHIDGKPLQRGKIVRLELETSLVPDKREIFLYLPHKISLSEAKASTRTTSETTAKNKSSRKGSSNLPSQSPELFPLLVMHDGSESLSLGQFHHILDHCIHAERIKPCVAVFIAPNLPKRNDEYTLNPNYLKFCLEEALPKALTEAKARGYEVSTKPIERCVAGASLGGLLSTYMSLHHPTEFGVVFAQSPAYWWQHGVIYNEEHLANAAQIRAILQTGTVADAHTLTLRMRDELTKRGAEVVYSEFVQGHTWGNWRTSFAQGILAWSEMMKRA
jgi:enterochelin esterase family protein